MHPAIRAARIRLSQITPRWMKAARTHALIALADKMEPRMRNSFLRAVDEMKGNIDMGLLAQAIGNNDRLLAYTSVFEKKWPSVLASTAKVPVETYGLAGGIASKGLGRIGIQTSFNLKSPEAINWARTNSSSLITNISSETRKGVQSVIGSAFDLGIPPKDAAKVIRDMVGLTEKQSIAASRYRDKISNQDRPADQVERMAARYESKLLRYRGETIARTEIIASAHQGQKEAWQQAVDEGLLDSSETNREWITTDDDRLCPICEPMNGQIVGLDEAFLDGDGEDVEEPPVHPNCRCTVGISFEAKTEQVASTPAIEEKEPEEAAASDGADDQPVSAGEEEPSDIEDIALDTSDQLTEKSNGLVEAKHDLDYFNQAAIRIEEQAGAIMNGPTSSFNRNQDVELSLILEQQGFNALPKLVTSEEAQSLESSGWTRLYRGVASGEPERTAMFIESFEKGDFYAGYGIFGNGTYTSTVRQTAMDYSGGRESGVMELLLNPKARVINYNDLDNLRAEFNKARHNDSMDYLQSDMGRFAAMSGYDAIRVRSAGFDVENEDYLVILNRSSLAKVVK